MFIRKVILENIGPYSECTTFDFSTSPLKNIILIGGKNGSGKTTLLKAIKIGIFGTFAFGLKTISDKYIDQLKSLLNYREIDIENAKFKISIFIEIFEEYQSFEYEFSRNWEVKNQRLVEVFDIFLNEKKLDLIDQNRVFEQVKEGFPPKVIDSAIYDGEKIADIIEDNEVSSYIESLFKTSFNLIYFEKLVADTESYIENEALANSMGEKEIEIFELDKKMRQFRQKIKDVDETIANYNKIIFEKQGVKRLNEYEFKKFDGIEKSDKDEILRRINSLENDKAILNQRIKHEIETNFLFLSSRAILEQIDHRMHKEKPNKLLSYIVEIEDYFRDSGFNMSEVKSSLNEQKSNSNHLLNVDTKTEKRIRQILTESNFDRICNFKKDVLEYFEVINNNKKFKEIMNTSNRSELDDIMMKIAEINSEISKYSEKLTDMNVEKAVYEKEYVEIKQSLTKAEAEHKYNRKSENSFDIARDVIKVLEESMTVIKRKNLNKVSALASATFKKILHKENYVSNIEIDDDFIITIFNSDNQKIPLLLLSAGEKQLIVSSLIYSIFKCSNREMFFVFDTPLARLDKDNRELFMKNLIEDISSQAIVLSTDSEINEELFRKIEPRISHTFTLEYNEVSNQTIILDKYFDFEGRD